MSIKAALLGSMMLVGVSSLAFADSTLVAAAPTTPDGGILSQAQVTATLEAQGYSDVKLTTEQPNLLNPQPEDKTASSRVGANPATTPVHHGWNGTAMRDGQLVNIYVNDQGVITRN